MIKSMTGFGRCELTEGDRKVTIEIKSVNHRYLDLGIKMPKKFNFFESAIRGLVKDYATRGKIDMFITYEDNSEGKAIIKYNKDIANEYVKYIGIMAEDYGLENTLTATALSRYPEVLDVEEQTIDEKELWAFMEKAIRTALEGFVDTRIKEGENLKNDILGKLDGMLANVDKVEKRSPETVKEYKKRLEEHLQEVLEDVSIDENRLATELVLYADKVCVDEETVRLRSHINHMKDVLISEEGAGRKLDFIAQEMNRESNTILSKASDMEISNIAIELKTEIEKVREQIQNIE